MTEPSQYSKEMAKGSVWSLAGGTLYKLISFLYLVLVAHTISQDDLGLFFLALNIVTIFSVADDLGLATALIRYVPFYEGKGEGGRIRPLLKSTYLLVTVSALALMALVWVASGGIGAAYSNQKLPEAIRALSFYLILSNLFKAGNSFVQGRADMKAMQSEQNVQNFLRLVLTIIFIYYYGPSVLSLAVGLLLSFLITIPLTLYDVSKSLQGIPKGKEGVTAKQMLGEIAPFGITLGILQSLGAVVSATNSLILGFLASTATVAVFSVATTIPYAVLAFSSAVGSIFLPLLSRLHGMGEREQIRKVADTAQRWTILASVPPTIAMMVFSPELITLVSGGGYLDGAPAMSIFSFALLISSLSLVFSLAFSAMRMIKVQLWILAAAGITNVILNILLIPRFGMAGSAFASVLSYALSTALLAFYSRRLMGFGFLKEGPRLAAASALSFAAVFLLRPYLPLPMFQGYYAAKAALVVFMAGALALSTAAFLLSVLLLRCLSMEDVDIMAKAMRRARLPDRLIKISRDIASAGVSGQKS